METPFTTEQFFSVFEHYNRAVFPIQFLWIVLGLAAAWWIYRRRKQMNWWIGIFLALLWIWNGVVYHWTFFTGINKAAYLFGGLFVVQGALIFAATIRRRLAFEFDVSARHYLGLGLLLFGLLIYPLIGFAIEGSVTRVIAPGLPCPTTILTFGFLLLVPPKTSRYLIIIPTLWAIVGTSAAINFGVYQDYFLILSAILADGFIIRSVRLARASKVELS